MATEEEAERAALGPMDLTGEEVAFEVIEDALTGTMAALREVRRAVLARDPRAGLSAPPPPLSRAPDLTRARAHANARPFPRRRNGSRPRSSASA